MGWLAGQVLRCTYDLFLDMEEQRQMLPEDHKCVCRRGRAVEEGEGSMRLLSGGGGGDKGGESEGGGRGGAWACLFCVLLYIVRTADHHIT